MFQIYFSLSLFYFFMRENQKICSNPNFPELSEFKLWKVSVSGMKAMCFKRHREGACLALICGGRSTYDVSFDNMDVRDVLFAMGVMAL